MLKSDHRFGEGATYVSFRNTTKAVAFFYAVALLLNAEGLHRGAERLPYGNFRDAAIAVAEPVAVVGRYFRLTAVRSFVERVANAKKEKVN